MNWRMKSSSTEEVFCYMLYPKEKDGLKIGLGFDASLIITI